MYIGTISTAIGNIWVTSSDHISGLCPGNFIRDTA